MSDDLKKNFYVGVVSSIVGGLIAFFLLKTFLNKKPFQSL